MLNSQSQAALLDGLIATDWSAEVDDNHRQATQLLERLAEQDPCAAPEGKVLRKQAEIDQLFSGSTRDVVQRITELDTDDEYLSKARAGLLHGSPLAVLWIDRQLQTAKSMNLAEVFQSELQLGTNIVRHPEFAEGVRALLIDKDKKPKWQYDSIYEVPDDVLDEFFEPPWPENPLHSL